MGDVTEVHAVPAGGVIESREGSFLEPAIAPYAPGPQQAKTDPKQAFAEGEKPFTASPHEDTGISEQSITEGLDIPQASVATSGLVRKHKI